MDVLDVLLTYGVRIAHCKLRHVTKQRPYDGDLRLALALLQPNGPALPIPLRGAMMCSLHHRWIDGAVWLHLDVRMRLQIRGPGASVLANLGLVRVR